MPTFIMTGTWTDQGIRGVKEAPKRAQAARDVAKKLDVEIKQAFLTSGESDLLLILETPNADNIPKFAMAIGSLGNAHTHRARVARSRDDQTYFRTPIAALSVLQVRRNHGRAGKAHAPPISTAHTANRRPGRATIRTGRGARQPYHVDN